MLAGFLFGLIIYTFVSIREGSATAEENTNDDENLYIENPFRLNSETTAGPPSDCATCFQNNKNFEKNCSQVKLLRISLIIIQTMLTLSMFYMIYERHVRNRLNKQRQIHDVNQ